VLLLWQTIAELIGKPSVPKKQSSSVDVVSEVSLKAAESSGAAASEAAVVSLPARSLTNCVNVCADGFVSPQKKKKTKPAVVKQKSASSNRLRSQASSKKDNAKGNGEAEIKPGLDLLVCCLFASIV
jgi:hypothetical protein